MAGQATSNNTTAANNIGSARKYLIYAFGEITLVVLGILIALSLNNWNQSRINSISEINYLERLQRELVADTASLSIQIQRMEQRIVLLESFATTLNDPDTDDVRLIEAGKGYFDKGWMLPALSTNKTTYNDLLSTGQFKIIRDENLRESIINLYLIYEGYELAVNTNSEWGMVQDAQMTMNTDALALDWRTEKLFGKLDDPTLAQKILVDKDVFTRNVAVHYWIITSSLDAFSYLKGKAETVLKMIDTALVQ